MAAITVRALETIEEHRAASDLLAGVWGRNHEGVPVPSEILRSMAHAGGLISGAYDGDELVGVAVLGRSEPGECYGYIAAARSGMNDRGLGFAVKQHQRTWALEHGLQTMTWTFDPLVARNARFNLTKLAATTCDYETGFYGVMADEVNGTDRADRLVPRWRLDSAAAQAAANGEPAEPPSPSEAAEVLDRGPDDSPAYLAEGASRWLRIPRDIVALRREDAGLAGAWRDLTGTRLPEAFAEGWVAVGMTRESAYHLVRRGEPAGDAPANDERTTP